MAIALRRTTAGKAQSETERDELAALAQEQRAALREEAVRALGLLGKGIARWEQEQWPWAPSDDAAPADPEAWTGLARVMFRLAQVNAIVKQLDWLAIAPDGPVWCVECRGPQENRPEGWYVGECPQHLAAEAMAVNIGNTLFGGDQ